MLAFVNTEVTKEQLVESLEEHRRYDRIRQGLYWDAVGGGCAVGCSIHDFRPGMEASHRVYEPLFGVPRELARLEDMIFESLPKEMSIDWPIDFARAIPVGADLSYVYDKLREELIVSEAGAYHAVDEDGHTADFEDLFEDMGYFNRDFPILDDFTGDIDEMPGSVLTAMKHSAAVTIGSALLKELRSAPVIDSA